MNSFAGYASKQAALDYAKDSHGRLILNIARLRIANPAAAERILNAVEVIRSEFPPDTDIGFLLWSLMHAEQTVRVLQSDIDKDKLMTVLNGNKDSKHG
jgi:hypothetical protein